MHGINLEAPRWQGCAGSWGSLTDDQVVVAALAQSKDDEFDGSELCAIVPNHSSTSSYAGRRAHRLSWLSKKSQQRQLVGV
jgi:hypothetical protein